MFSIVAEQIYIPIASGQGFPFLHILVNASVLFFLLFLKIIGILTGVRCYLIVALFCVSMMTSDLNIFSYTCWPFVCLLWRNVYLGLCPFLNCYLSFLLLRCLSALRILNINSLDVLFANVFSHSIDCLFTLLIIYFAMQSVFSL